MSVAPTVVIGAGVNELVCAHYLARAGRHVVVLGQNPLWEVRTRGWIPPAIMRDLHLESRGLQFDRADPWVAVPLAQGGRLELWHDMARSVEAIGRLSAADAAKWPAFCDRMARIARVLESLYTTPPPSPLGRGRTELMRLAAIAWHARRLGRQAIEDFMRVMTMPIADLLDDWFESDALKVALGASAVAHISHGPRAGGTAFAFLHHHVGLPAGVFRSPRSNLAQVLTALPGIEIRRGATVASLALRDGRATGVVLASGEEIPAGLVVSGADPRRTLTQWVEGAWLDPDAARAVRHIRARGVSARMVLTLAQAPDFSTLALAASLDAIERAADDAKYGCISREPWLEARSLGPDANGRHRVEVDIQYTPYTLADGAWSAGRCADLAERALTQLARHVRDLAAVVLAHQIVSPPELEAEYGYPEGQVHHAELALDQALWMRPTPELAHYRTPVAGLYLCGPGTHPGAGIAGASGANAARTILEDAR